jgi:hypothetical protein
MAAGAYNLYSQALLEMGNGSFNLSTNTFVMILATSAYTPAPNTDATYANVSADELATGNGYTVGGEVLSGVTFTTTGGVATFTCTSPTWASFSGTFRYGIILSRAGSSLASTDKLLCYSDLGGGASVTGGGGTLTVTTNASGIFTISHTP